MSNKSKGSAQKKLRKRSIKLPEKSPNELNRNSVKSSRKTEKSSQMKFRNKLKKVPRKKLNKFSRKISEERSTPFPEKALKKMNTFPETSPERA